MDILQFLLIGVEVIVSILLVLIILVQKTKSGGGMGTAFGGGGAETIFGSRAGNVLTKATIILGVCFLMNTLFLAILFANKNDELLMNAATTGALSAPPPAASTDNVPVAPPAQPVAPVAAPIEPIPVTE